jgi:FkbM family methyltransferase
MGNVNRIRRHVAWALIVAKRLAWGAREVGVRGTLAGFGRLGWLAIRKPKRSIVNTTATGLRIAFEYPEQLMPLLVIFREVLEPELDLLPRLLGPSAIAIDVGASIGTWTLSAARTGAHVHACEPDAANLSMLIENIDGNGLRSNVTVHELAMGSGNGWSQVEQAQRRYLTRVKLAADAQSGTRLYSLANFVRERHLNRVDVLKVNTAGSESDVIEGARELFREQRIRVAIILDGLAVRPLLREMTSFGYQMGFYDGPRAAFNDANDYPDLDRLRPGPLNRYIILKQRTVEI